MHVPSRDIEARVSALEAYVDIPTEHTGMTVTGRLEAQHKLLVAFRAEFIEFRDATNRRLTALEDMMGQVLYGMTEIKRLLTPADSAP